MPEAWFQILQNVAGFVSIEMFVPLSLSLLHVTAQDLIPCTPPTGQPTCVYETNKGTINLTILLTD